MFKLAILLSFSLVVGCAGVGVMSTNNPHQKIADAYQLMNDGRGLLAKKLAGEALEIFQKQNDQLNIARAHSVLGDINRDGKGANLPNYGEAGIHFKEAAEIYEKLKEPKWQAFNLYALAGVQSLDGNPQLACQTLKLSKQIYTNAPDAKKATENFEKGGAFSLSSFPSLEKSFKCK